MELIIFCKNRKCLYPFRSPSKVFYEIPVNILPFFWSFTVTSIISPHFYEHPTIFITISRQYIDYSKNIVSRTSCRTLTISQFSITIFRTRVFTNYRHKFFPKKVISEHPVPCPEFGRGWCEKSVTPLLHTK
jgi:hypothetical protein